MTTNISLIPGKLYRIKSEHYFDVMRSCDGGDYSFMYKNLYSPMLLLKDFKGFSGHNTQYIKFRREDTITTIFLIENKTVEFRTMPAPLSTIEIDARTLFLNALVQLQ